MSFIFRLDASFKSFFCLLSWGTSLCLVIFKKCIGVLKLSAATVLFLDEVAFIVGYVPVESIIFSAQKKLSGLARSRMGVAAIELTV